MTQKNDSKPVFFEEDATDPVVAATGGAKNQEQGPQSKRKAGFYLSQDLLDRFNTKFYQLKLAGLPVDNKSGLLELALEYALDDLDQEDGSRLLARLQA